MPTTSGREREREGRRETSDIVEKRKIKLKIHKKLESPAV
jgi:hypothetical protein